MSIKVVMAAMLERELVARGVQSLGYSDCVEIVEKVLQRLIELDRQLISRSFDRQH
ncbi:hypothetical protein IVB27_39670 [Bradyrhizobium sp. 197]|uniref:hypothetical protein n=1 Tax=unclassified Bradyrhizobium TaxID=2631580 RepID=UPI0018DFFBFF|nr:MULTISPECIES: hypothetical protein [unclassified Bradyrhizobium]MCK1480681.1 hypothetical protein [Bradyrhizobium sp. 197]